MNSTYLPKDRTSKGNSTFHRFPPTTPPEFHQPGKIDCYHQKDCKLTPHPDSITIIPPFCSSKDPFIFPKNHFFSPKIHTFLFPFPN